MSCDRYTDAIVDHACGADLADDAAAHLRGCPACRRTLEEQRQVLQGLDSDLQEALAIEPSAWFEAQTLAGLERTPIRRRRAFWWIAVAAAAAVIILGTLVAIRSGDRSTDRSSGGGRTPSRPAGYRRRTGALERRSGRGYDKQRTGLEWSAATSRARGGRGASAG